MPAFYPHSRPTEKERDAIRDVGSLLEQADEDRADESLVQQANREEDREWAKRTDNGADASESASTIRILDQWREDRERGVDADDFHLGETDSDQALLDDLPGGDSHGDLDARTKKAIESVGEVLRHGVVDHQDDEEPEFIDPEDYVAHDQILGADFPSYAEGPPQEAPPPKGVEDPDDDGYHSDEHVIRRSDTPPPFNPHG